MAPRGLCRGATGLASLERRCRPREGLARNTYPHGYGYVFRSELGESREPLWLLVAFAAAPLALRVSSAAVGPGRDSPGIHTPTGMVTSSDLNWESHVSPYGSSWPLPRRHWPCESRAPLSAQGGTRPEYIPPRVWLRLPI